MPARRHINTAHQPLSRREFLSLTAATGGSLAGIRFAGGAPPSLHLPAGTKPSRVVQAHNPYVIDGLSVHRILLREMMDRTLQALTGTARVADAWRSILAPNDIVGIKFNRSGQAVLGTTNAFATTLIESIVEAGWRRDQIVCIEAPLGVAESAGTTAPLPGYDTTPTDFKSGSDQLAKVLSQVTALIDVPFLKHHNIAGLTCSLKNLSHGLVKHPARYHANGCSPYVADIVARTPIRSKLRLCLVDALRVVYAGGPDPAEGTISNEGIVLASLDPVAVDVTALAILNDVQSRYAMSSTGIHAEEVGYLAAAHNLGLGIGVWHGINLVRLVPE